MMNYCAARNSFSELADANAPAAGRAGAPCPSIDEHRDETANHGFVCAAPLRARLVVTTSKAK
jgi:hypothetical protein